MEWKKRERDRERHNKPEVCWPGPSGCVWVKEKCSLKTAPELYTTTALLVRATGGVYTIAIAVFLFMHEYAHSPTCKRAQVDIYNTLAHSFIFTRTKFCFSHLQCICTHTCMHITHSYITLRLRLYTDGHILIQIYIFFISYNKSLPVYSVTHNWPCRLLVN